MLTTLKVTLPDGDVTYTRDGDGLGKFYLTDENTLLVTDEIGRTIGGFVAGIWLYFSASYAAEEES